MISLTDREAFHYFPKFSWVYETTKLLDSQQIQWSLFKDDYYQTEMAIFNIPSSIDKIYIREPIGDTSTVDILLYRGELKWSSKPIEGSAKLKLYAIIAMHLMKFSGILKVKYDTYSGLIVGMSLSYTKEDYDNFPKEIKSKIEKIYK